MTWCPQPVCRTLKARHRTLINTRCSCCQNVLNACRTCLIHHLHYYAHVNSCSTVFLPCAFLRITEQPITHTLPYAHSRRDIPPTPPSHHPSECWQLRKRAAGMRRNRLVDNGRESELRYWFKCSHMVSFTAGEGMIKSTGAAHKCRSAGFRFSARIMCCRTFWLDADVGNEPQITPRLWFDEVPLKCCLKCFAKVWSLVSWMEYSKRNLWRLGSFIAA